MTTENNCLEKEGHTVKKVIDFPVPNRDVMSLTKLSLAGNNLKESLISDIPAGDGKIANLFLQSRGRQREKLGELTLLEGRYQ